MVISRINTVFAKHHRWLFGGIVLVVIITFVFYFSSGSIFDISFGGNSTVAARIYDRNITADELQTQRFAVLVTMSLNAGEDAPEQLTILLNSQTEEAVQTLDTYAFYRIANLELAKRHGIGVSNDMVMAFLRESFSVDGVYSSALYDRFIGTLSRYGISIDQLVQAVREELLIIGLFEQLNAAAAYGATPGLLNRMADSMNVVYKVTVAQFNAADFVKDAVPEEGMVKAYYDSNPQEFAAVAEYTAKLAYARPELPEFSDAAIAAATDAEIESFFELNKDLYMPEDGAEITLDAVREEVVNDYIDFASRRLAMNKVGEFSIAMDDMFRRNTGSAESFVKLATEAGFELIDTAVFAADASAVVLADGTSIADPEFTRMVQRSTINTPVTEVYMGADRIFVGLINEEKPAGIKPFDTVADEIRDSLTSATALAMARAAAAEAYREAATNSPDKMFESIAANEYAHIATPDPMPPIDYLGIFNRPHRAESLAILNLKIGEVSPLVETSSGASVLRLDAMEAQRFILNREQTVELLKRRLQNMASTELYQQLSANIFPATPATN